MSDDHLRHGSLDFRPIADYAIERTPMQRADSIIVLVFGRDTDGDEAFAAIGSEDLGGDAVIAIAKFCINFVEANGQAVIDVLEARSATPQKITGEH